MSEEDQEEEGKQEGLEESYEEPSQSPGQEAVNNREPPSNARRVTQLAVVGLVAGIILALLLAFLSRFGLLGRTVEAPIVTYFAEDQLIVTGNISDVIDVTQNVEAQLGVQLIRVDNVDEEKIPAFILNAAPGTLTPTVAVPADPDNDAQSENVVQQPALQADNDANTSIFLYRVIFTNSITIENVVQAIGQESLERGKAVASGLNYAIGSPPLEVLGDPNCGEGTAITESLSISTEDAKSIFYNQWGLNTTNEVFSSGNMAAITAGIKLESSIGLFNSVSKDGIVPTRTISDNILGANVIVAVFDTSPFDLRGERVLDTEVTDPIDDFGSDIVNHFETIGDPDVRDHGVFGASLVDVIAPESDIRFYRVLDQSNRGDLYTLLRALESLSQTWKVETPLVINMSLGIHPPPDSESEADLTILENILRSFYDRGAVIVAAAGNDSAERSLMGLDPAPMQYPAAYDFVIGVGASNAKNEMSCFSNNANIWAPGGDNGAGCLPAVHECAVAGIGAAACMVGYVYTPPNAHYAYWNGTSFAAPLVSGAAALLMGEGLNRTNEEVYAILAPTLSGTTVTGAAISTPHVLDLADAVNQAAALPTPTPQP